MNVVLHSAQNILYLLAAVFSFGILTAFFRVFLEDSERFVASIFQKRFISFRDYVSIEINNLFLSVSKDLIICFVAAGLLLFSSLVYNSGNFKLVSFPIFILGYFFGIKVLRRLFKSIVPGVFFCFKWVCDIAAFPLIWFLTVIAKSFHVLFDRMKRRYRVKVMAKYTAQSLLSINDDAKYGLIDVYYKELENERTV